LSARFSVYESLKKSGAEMSVDYRRSLSPAQIVELDKQLQAWQPSPAACKQRIIR
jgi:hypothetical protein